VATARRRQGVSDAEGANLFRIALRDRGAVYAARRGRTEESATAHEEIVE
jgi:hypothetical protein